MLTFPQVIFILGRWFFLPLNTFTISALIASNIVKVLIITSLACPPRARLAFILNSILLYQVMSVSSFRLRNVRPLRLPESRFSTTFTARLIILQMLDDFIREITIAAFPV